jgi:translation initiation factor 2 subunit 2
MTEEDINFDLAAKKKKKKKKTPFDPESTEKEVEEKGEEGGDEGEVNGDIQEKKVAFNEPDDVDMDDIDLESFGKKKKKKKKREGLEDMAELKENLPDDDDKEEEVDDDLDLTDFGDKKKKKKRSKKKDLDDLIGDEDKDEQQDENPWMESDRDYTYEELLQRVFSIMRDKNPEMVDGRGKKFIMRPPQVVRVGAKKTAFANFTEIAKMLHRQPKHLLAFLFAELGTSGAIDGSNQLIMKGRFQQKHIENVLRRYIKEYVTCHTCRSPDTILNKETRLFFLQCMTCHSSCSVQTIKTGFQAVTSKRAAIRAKQ